MKKICLLLALLAAAASGAAAQTLSSAGLEPDAVVNFSAGYLRAEPDYEAPLETQILMGTPVAVVDSSSYWRKVITPDYTAWINVLGLAPLPEGYVAAPKYICTAEYSHVFAEPSDGAARLSDLVLGDLLRIAADRKGAPLRRKGFCRVLLPSGAAGWVPRKDVAEFSGWAAGRNPTPDNIVATALRFTGIPYLWGGNSVKGFDCSGLVKLSFFLNGVVLPRNASQQVSLGTELDVNGVPDGDFSALAPGDLLFFGSRETGRVTHVALYIGDGRIVHSSQLVRVNSLRPRDPDYYENAGRLLYGRRILGTPDAAPLTGAPWYFPKK